MAEYFEKNSHELVIDSITLVQSYKESTFVIYDPSVVL